MYKCRPIIDGHFVWFNSKGKDANNKAVKYREDGSNFAEQQDGFAQSLTQRLSALRGELWYNVEHGIPLFDKVRTKIEMDVEVATIIERHPEVISIDKFTSTLSNGHYNCNIIITSSFGSLDIQV